MPPAPLPEHLVSFLAGAHPAVVATLRADGSPHSTVTWYEWRDGRILLNLDDIRPRLRWMRRDGRLALTVIDREDIYRHVSLLGAVERIVPDDDRSDIDALAMRYTGAPYPRHAHPRVSVWMRVDAWHAWDRSPRDPGEGRATRS